MKKIIPAFILFFSISASAIDSQPINFNEAVHLTLSSNPVILENAAKIRAEQALIREKRGNALPSLSMEMNAASSDNALNVFSYKLSQQSASFRDFGFAQYTGPESINIQPTVLNHPGYYTNINNGLVLNVPIFSGGASLQKIKEARYLLMSAQAGSQEAKAMLIYNLLQSYEGAITANEILKNIQLSENAAKKYLSMTKSLKAQSVLIKGDVLLANFNLRSQKTAMKIAQSREVDALNAFRILIGQPNSNILPGKSVSLLIPVLSQDKLEQVALYSNSSLKAIEMQVKAAHSEIKVAQSDNLPLVNLQLRHDWNANNYSFSNPSNTALLQLSWKLFSSGAQIARDKKAIAQYDLSYAKENRLMDNVRLSVFKTIQDIHTSQLQANENMKNIIDLKEVVTSYENRFGKGLLTLGQLLDAQNRLNQARNQLLISKYHLILAKARLLILLNQFPFQKM